MSPGLRVSRFWFMALVVGCGCNRSLSTADPGDPPPHGGRIVRFADGSGFIEVVKKEGPAPITAEVSFYFFKNAYTPYEPEPGSGVLMIDEKRRVPLRAEGDALVTPTGPVLFADQEVDGVLSIELGGKSRQVPLGMR